MHFSNVQVPIEGLPQVEAVKLQPLEKEYLQVRRIIWLITFSLVLLILFSLAFFIDDLQQWFIVWPVIIVFFILSVLTWIGITVSFRNSGYAIREKDILFRNGWLVRRTRIIPLNRVQHISVQSGPFERQYGLAAVSVYTAGAEHADFTLRGIHADTAQQIKDWVTGQLHGMETTQ